MKIGNLTVHVYGGFYETLRGVIMELVEYERTTCVCPMNIFSDQTKFDNTSKSSKTC